MIIPFSFWGSAKPAIPLTGLKMYFNFDNGGYSGTTVTDFAGVQNGTLSGTTYNSGNGGYMNFDGTNDWIDTNRTSNGSDIGIFFGSWSIVYCFRVPNITGTKHVFGSSNAPSYQNNAQSGVIDDDIFYSHNSGGEPKFLNISANTWYHVVCTYNYDTYVCKIYINGVEQVSNGFQERMVGVYSVYLGRTNTSYYAFDLGLAMIYNRVITAQEVSDIFNNQKDRFGL